MKKKILIAEYCRLTEIHESNIFHCPVCKASVSMKSRFNPKNCSITPLKTACHPEIQKRCNKTINMMCDLTMEIEKMRREVVLVLRHAFGMTLIELGEEYLKFRKNRLGNIDNVKIALFPQIRREDNE